MHATLEEEAMTVAAPPAPVAVPVEPTTPIKPSEAIRLGCLLAPVQAFGLYVDGEARCVIGTAALAYGEEPAVTHIREGWWFLNVSCPADGCLSLARPLHLNDTHRWTRERIADWLESLGL
jgi:hypothetical protein